MESVTDAEPRITSVSSDREAWTLARRRLERGRYWWGPGGRATRAVAQRAVSRGGERPGAGLRITGHYPRWRRAALEPGLVELELRFPDLPSAFDGYRILHLSDSRLDVLPELATIARDLLAGIEADLLVLTGDVLRSPRAAISVASCLLVTAIEGLSVRDGRLAVSAITTQLRLSRNWRASGFAC